MADGADVGNRIRGDVAGSVVQAGTIQRVVLSQSRSAALPVPRLLPPAVRDFTGRAQEMNRLDSMLPTAPQEGEGGEVSVVAVLEGTAGVGKTMLALRWRTGSRIAFPVGRCLRICAAMARAHRWTRWWCWARFCACWGWRRIGFRGAASVGGVDGHIEAGVADRVVGAVEAAGVAHLGPDRHRGQRSDAVVRGLQRAAGRLAAADELDLISDQGHFLGEPVDLAHGRIDGGSGGRGQRGFGQPLSPGRGHGLDVQVGAPIWNSPACTRCSQPVRSSSRSL